MECSICCDKFNKQTRYEVKCSYCSESACRTCVQRYILDTTQDAHCMFCKHTWNREFIDQSCTQVFRMKKLKAHRENILFERQKCMMPSTQAHVEHELMHRDLKKELHHLEDVLNDTLQKIRTQNHLIVTHQNSNVGQSERREFVRKCPLDDCKGFLSTAWKCGICKNNVCRDCNEQKGEDHTCDPNNVETAKLLKKDTKPCPKCGVLIFKISGCAQMWCVDCHTTFNWNTLRIECGVIHNPHFFELRRKLGNTGRELGDIPCGGLPSPNEIRTTFSNNKPVTDILFNIYRCVSHIEHWEIPTLRTTERDYTSLRVSYMLNELSEDMFKHTLQRDEKAVAKSRDLENIFRMLVNTVSDFLRRCIIEKDTIYDLINDMNVVRMYFNDSMTVLSNRYKSRCRIINDAWHLDL